MAKKRERVVTCNKVRCKRCKEVIESTSVHDFKWCKCKCIAVDGGKMYLKRCGDMDGYEELSEYKWVWKEAPGADR